MFYRFFFRWNASLGNGMCVLDGLKLFDIFAYEYCKVLFLHIMEFCIVFYTVRKGSNKKKNGHVLHIVGSFILENEFLGNCIYSLDWKFTVKQNRKYFL